MTHTTILSARRCAVALGVIASSFASATLGAQQAVTSAAAFGMNNNFVALGQGVDALAFNPAMLGMPGNTKFSLNLFTPSGAAGLAPVSWNDFMQYAKSNDSIPSSVRRGWLSSVTSNGGETGSQNGSINWLALSMGHLALSASTSEALQTSINPDAFQAAMFGNAGYTGSLQTLNFANSGLRLGAYTTLAAGLGIPTGSSSAIGVTLKYVLGNFLVIGQDNGSAITANNVSVKFPLVMSNTSNIGSNITNGGSGFGADVGYAWRNDKTTFSAAVQNIFNSFAWNTARLQGHTVTALFNGTTSTSKYDTVAYAAAPQSLQSLVSEYQFKPAFLAGIAYKANRLTTLTADVHQQFGDTTSILIGPRTQVGGGLEFRGIPILPLRAGLSYITGGWSASGGVGLSFGAWEIGVAGLTGHRSGGNENGIMVSALSFK